MGTPEPIQPPPDESSPQGPTVAHSTDTPDQLRDWVYENYEDGSSACILLSEIDRQTRFLGSTILDEDGKANEIAVSLFGVADTVLGRIKPNTRREDIVSAKNVSWTLYDEEGVNPFVFVQGYFRRSAGYEYEQSLIFHFDKDGTSVVRKYSEEDPTFESRARAAQAHWQAAKSAGTPFEGGVASGS